MGAADGVDVALYTRLGETYLQREQRIKQEIASVSILWLVGCPLLCLFPLTSSGSIYGKPDLEMCGLISFSVSASMTGLYPKVLGCLMAPLFAVLVVQRTSNGLCSILKLGWLVRFSPLVAGGSGQKRDRRPKVQASNDVERSALALQLWKRIEKIEFLGYLAGSFLVALVALDAQDFTIAHMIIATMAFFSLHRQNYLVGTLGTDFESLFPNWTSGHASFLFHWAMFHLCLMYVAMFGLRTIYHRGGCKDLLEIINSMFGDTTLTVWLGSVAVWANEYAFAFLCIYVQLLRHYELRLWDFAGPVNMPYIGIVSRFSVRATAGRLLGGSSDAEVFLGMPMLGIQEGIITEGQKAKAS